MKRNVLLLYALFGFYAAFAQRSSYIWYFGNRAGIDFNGGSPPAALTNSVMNSAEGSAVISDESGNLLFYTDGQSVWDRSHTLMPNGGGLTGDKSATQSAVIVPKPGHQGRYYVFTVGSNDVSPGNIPFSYSEVNMALNGGMGDVVTATKNTLLFRPSAERVTAVRHANGLYFWVIGQELNTGRYRSYLVDCDTVRPAVISDVGHTTTMGIGVGYMTVSVDGSKVAIAARHAWMAGHFFICDFDNSTGVLSGLVNLGATNQGPYGVSFSPSGRYLYGVGVDQVNDVIQWDMQAGTPAAIIASSTIVGTAAGNGPYRGGGMQLGPDRKIYMVQYNQAWLSVINDPEAQGTACNLQMNAINLSSRAGVLGLPSFVQDQVRDTIAFAHTCSGDSTIFSMRGTQFLDSLVWQFGDPSSGSNNESRLDTPFHQYSAGGLYHVRLIRYLACVTDTVERTVLIRQSPYVDLGRDTMICADSMRLQPAAGYPGGSYLWSTGATDSTILVSGTGLFWLAVTQDGCTGRDSIRLEINPNLPVDLGPDTGICDRDLPLVLFTPQPAGTRYRWSNGLSSERIEVNRSGTYWVHVSRNGCAGSDTVVVDVVPTPVFDIGNDSTICSQFPYEIGAFVPGAQYTWNTGAITSHIFVDSTGSYILEVNLSGCRIRDTADIVAMPVPDIDLGGDRDICPEQTIVLDATYGVNSRYRWNTGDTSETYAAVAAGVYQVQVISEHGCVGGDTVLLSAYPLPTVFAGEDTVVCEETPLLLRPWKINADSLLWYDGTAGDTRAIYQGGVYIVHAVNKCGIVSDTITVRQIFCDILVPNAFSPNGDGTNDLFRILGNTGRMQGTRLSVFNRWGERLFYTEDKYRGWDGMHKGSEAQIGTYVYLLEYSIDGKPYRQKGNFHLLR